MSKRMIALLAAATVIFGITYALTIRSKELQTIVSPYQISKTESEKEDKLNLASVFARKKEKFGDVINILLIGTDTSYERRSRGQLGFNTDSMIMVSINSATNQVVLTSVPRDLWINGNKINALYTVYGEEVLVNAFEKTTGQEVDGVIRADFDQFRWLVDAFGGIPVDVVTTFTDTSFPNKYDSDVETVSFTQGTEVMDGWRALTFARSRKGNNGEGSDLMRARRQHLLLKGFVEAAGREGSSFWPMNVERFYTAVTNQEIYTTLSLEDVEFLWDFYKDKDLYQVKSLVVDDKYVYHPGMYPDSEYTAWVFIAKEPGFENLHNDIQAMLNGTYSDPTLDNAPDDTSSL